MPHRTIRINPEGVIAELSRSLQRTMDLVAFGVQAADTPFSATSIGFAQEVQDQTTELAASVSEAMRLPGVVLPFALFPASALTPESARPEFQRWVLANGFRDAIEAIGTILEQARIVRILASVGGQMSIEEWNTQIAEGAKRFDRMSLPDKIQRLTDICGPVVIPSLTEQVKTVVAARNCLVHRRGVVGERDVNHQTAESNGLQLEWVANLLVVIPAVDNRGL